MRKEIEVLPKQADVVECECLYLGAYGGVGSGKTFSAQWKMFKRARMYPDAGHYVVGADFQQLREGYFLDLRNLLEDLLGWEEGRDFRYRENPRPTIIFTDTRTRIRALSAEIAERIRSTQIQSLHAEEPQTWHNGENVWRTLVGRMRHSVRSAKMHPDMPIQAWLTFNPGGDPGAPVGSWLHELVEKRWAEDPVRRCAACRARDPEHQTGYPSFRFSLRDNYLLHDAAQYVRNLETNLPTHLWPVEIDGHWPTSGGDVYRSFDFEVHAAAPPAGLPAMGLRNAPLMWAHDFNVDFMCSVVAQTFMQQPIVEYIEGVQRASRMPVPNWQRFVCYVIDEITLPDAGVEDVVREFLKRYGDHARRCGVVLYGDASGGARSQLMSSQSAIRTNWEAVVNGLRGVGIPVSIRIQSANPSVGDRINETNEQLHVGGGYGVLVDPNRCPELVTDWRTVRRDKHGGIDKSANTPEQKRRTHTSDAAGYMFWVERRLQKRGPGSVDFTMVR